MLSTIPVKERELAEISRQQNIKNNIYSFLLEKREQTSFSLRSAEADSKIIDYAEILPDPVSPKTLYVLLAAVVASMAMGVAFVMGRDLLSRNILYRTEI